MARCSLFCWRRRRGCRRRFRRRAVTGICSAGKFCAVCAWRYSRRGWVAFESVRSADCHWSGCCRFQRDRPLRSTGRRRKGWACWPLGALRAGSATGCWSSRCFRIRRTFCAASCYALPPQFSTIQPQPMLPDCCGCFLPFHFRINLHEISAVFKSRVEVFHSSAGSARNLKSELSQISGCLRIKTTIFRLCPALINFQFTEHPIRCGLDVPPIPPDSLCRFFFLSRPYCAVWDACDRWRAEWGLSSTESRHWLKRLGRSAVRLTVARRRMRGACAVSSFGRWPHRVVVRVVLQLHQQCDRRVLTMLRVLWLARRTISLFFFWQNFNDEIVRTRAVY